MDRTEREGEQGWKEKKRRLPIEEPGLKIHRKEARRTGTNVRGE